MNLGVKTPCSNFILLYLQKLKHDSSVISELGITQLGLLVIVKIMKQIQCDKANSGCSFKFNVDN